MSSIGAWELTVGKIFGAPIFAICGASIALFLIVIASVLQGISLSITLRIAVTLCAVFVLICAGGLGRSLLFAQEMRGQRRLKANSGGLGMVLGCFFMIGPVVSLANFLESIKTKSDTLSAQQIDWWGIQLAPHDFITSSLVIFMLWSVLGAYRLMQAELQFKQRPTVWTLFCFFLWFYLAPFWPEPSDVGAAATALLSHIGLLLYPILLYPDLCSGFKDIIGLRRFVSALKGSDLRKAWSLTPRWMISLLFFATTVAASLLTARTLTERALLVASLLFVIRDAGVIISFHIRAPNHRRNGVAALVYLIFVYGLGPLCFGTAERSLSGLFYPMNPSYSLVGGAIGAAVALLVVRDTWESSASKGH